MRAIANPRSPPHRVLVVDDHVASADLLLEILSMEGYVARVAYCGRDAVAIARDFKPQIAILDVGLPDLDGFAVARLIKADPELREIRLIGLSGYAQSPNVDSSTSGFDHYLVKPVDVEELLSLLQRLGL